MGRLGWRLGTRDLRRSGGSFGTLRVGSNVHGSWRTVRWWFCGLGEGWQWQWVLSKAGADGEQCGGAGGGGEVEWVPPGRGVALEFLSSACVGVSYAAASACDRALQRSRRFLGAFRTNPFLFALPTHVVL